MKHAVSVQACADSDGHADTSVQACAASDSHADATLADAAHAVHLANAAASPAEAVPQYNAARALGLGLAVSLAVHGLIAALFWLMPAWLQAQAPADAQTLQMELFGMLSNRQEQEQMQGLPDDAPPPEPQAEPIQQPEPEPEPLPEPEPEPEPLPEPEPEPPPEPPPPEVEPPEPSPVQVKPPPKQKPTPRPAPAPRPAVRPPPAPKGAEVARVQQTIAPPDMQTLMQAYVRELSRMLQRSLVYPREARREGYVGSTTVRFSITENGSILPGSLSIQRSSGYAILDEQALKTANSSAPFPAPPKPMTVSIAIAFRER